MFLDSHAHLEPEYYGEELERVIQDAWDAGVQLILAIGNGTPKDHNAEAVIAVAEGHDFIYAAVGVHPHEADSASPKYLMEIRRLAEHEKVIAWGEVGLDYHYNVSSKAQQKDSLVQQLGMARDSELPVVFHCREAEGDLIKLLEESVRRSPWGVIHSFTGPQWFADRVLDLGLFISFSGILTFKSAEDLRDVAKRVPIDRLLVETDSPYLAPVPHRGSRNEPRFVSETARLLAQLRGVRVEELMKQIRMNFRSLFGV